MKKANNSVDKSVQEKSVTDVSQNAAHQLKKLQKRTPVKKSEVEVYIYIYEQIVTLILLKNIYESQFLMKFVNILIDEHSSYVSLTCNR